MLRSIGRPARSAPPCEFIVRTGSPERKWCRRDTWRLLWGMRIFRRKWLSRRLAGLLKHTTSYKKLPCRRADTSRLWSSPISWLPIYGSSLQRLIRSTPNLHPDTKYMRDRRFHADIWRDLEDQSRSSVWIASGALLAYPGAGSLAGHGAGADQPSLF